MGMMTLVLADSGFGKTYSLRNVKPVESAALLCRCIKKNLPFSTKNSGWALHGKLVNGQPQRGNVVDIRDGLHLLNVIRSLPQTPYRMIIVDDFQAIMQIENLNRAYETGYTKFTEMAEHAFRIIEAAAQLPDGFNVYFMAHTEEVDGIVRMKTCGKMLNEKLTPEGHFPIVLRIVKKDGRHMFALKGADNDTVKCPPDLFPGMTEMDNDLAAFNAAITDFSDL